jgi:hypothetical protein
MDCLIDYIGVKGCGNSTPPSGLYLNELAGISVESLAKVSKPEQETYLAVWADIQKRAARKFNSAIVSSFAKRYRLIRIKDNVSIGREIINDLIPAIPNSFRGFAFLLDPLGVGSYSPMLSITLTNLKFYSTQAGTFDFTIGTEGTDTYLNFSQDLSVGWNLLKATYIIPVANMAGLVGVVVHSSTLETGKTEIPIADSTGGSGCPCSCSLSSCCSVEIKGFAATNGVVTLSENAHGFSCDIALGCSFDSLVCYNRTAFSTALWYLMGAETMIERLFSDRINKWTTIDRAKAEALLEYYTTQYTEELGSVVDGIDLVDSDCCLECNPQVSYRWAEL